MTFSFDPTQLVAQLTRIADALDRAIPFIDPKRLESLKKRGPEAIINYGDNNKQWLREQLTGIIHERGLPPSQEREILDEAIAGYDPLSEL